MGDIRKIKAGLVKTIDRTEFVGEVGNIFFDVDTGELFLSDGVTPGGIPLGSGGGIGTTDSLPEGSTNLYYTDARTRNALSATGDLTYNSTTGQFSVTTYKSSNFDVDFDTKTTDDLAEGLTNFYFTDAKLDSTLATKSISIFLDIDDSLTLTEDSILVYNTTGNYFTAETFLSVLERLKAELEVQYDKLVDEDGAYTYIGEADPGTAKNSLTWRIKRIEELAGGDLEILWANGTASFDKSWDLRSTYSY